MLTLTLVQSALSVYPPPEYSPTLTLSITPVAAATHPLMSLKHPWTAGEMKLIVGAEINGVTCG